LTLPITIGQPFDYKVSFQVDALITNLIGGGIDGTSASADYLNTISLTSAQVLDEGNPISYSLTTQSGSQNFAALDTPEPGSMMLFFAGFGALISRKLWLKLRPSVAVVLSLSAMVAMGVTSMSAQPLKQEVLSPAEKEICKVAGVACDYIKQYRSFPEQQRQFCDGWQKNALEGAAWNAAFYAIKNPIAQQEYKQTHPQPNNLMKYMIRPAIAN
jgi:hypothetical protein